MVIMLWFLVFLLIAILFIRTSDIKDLFKRLEELEKRVQYLSDNVLVEWPTGKTLLIKNDERLKEPPWCRRTKSTEIQLRTGAPTGNKSPTG